MTITHTHTHQFLEHRCSPWTTTTITLHINIGLIDCMLYSNSQITKRIVRNCTAHVARGLFHVCRPFCQRSPHANIHTHTFSESVRVCQCANAHWLTRATISKCFGRLKNAILSTMPHTNTHHLHNSPAVCIGGASTPITSPNADAILCGEESAWHH